MIFPSFGGKSRQIHRAVFPPLTPMICPVTKSALSDARKTIVAAMSSGVPRRRAGTPAARAAFLSAPPREAVQQLSLHGSGRDCVHTYAGGSALESCRFRESLDRMRAGDIH